MRRGKSCRLSSEQAKDSVYLLDTNVVSELRKPRPHGAVVAWLNSVDDVGLHLATVTLCEIQAGIELTREQDAEKAAEIESWLDLVTDAYNLLPMDAPAFRCWAKLMHRKSDIRYEDAMFAAIAKVKGLTVVTRNVSDFSSFGIGLLNPFEFWLEARKCRLIVTSHRVRGASLTRNMSPIRRNPRSTTPPAVA